ncbi:unnamed protein product [Prorocentrum cordatum]|uniref:DUF445 domain-containing protein n=1 Tax=Prorocentrum cordatum TaxID=2364126 RepID=A0ABN9SV00_9DINO|nr:unnamed protein product [Polarella glacialis]
MARAAFWGHGAAAVASPPAPLPWLQRLLPAGILVSATAVCRAFAQQFWTSPLAYSTIPVVAALVGYGTNWVGVKMIFYPIEFFGIPVRRWPQQPLGMFGWQGIVPAKTQKMSKRLVDIVTSKLLSMKEAFANLDPEELAKLLEPEVSKAIQTKAAWGEAWIAVVRPQLDRVLVDVVKKMQADIDKILDLDHVVSSAFLRDKVLLGQLFQKAGRKELAFLVDSGLTFGFFLGIIQMALWILVPNSWTLPLGGALVGYITNWVAIKLIFDPVEPVQVGPFVMQGLFEKRQPEVSIEFSEFLATRVLCSPRLIQEMCSGWRAGLWWGGARPRRPRRRVRGALRGPLRPRAQT